MKKLTSIFLAMLTVLCAFSGTTVFADDEYIPYHICEYEEYIEPSKYSVMEAQCEKGEKGLKCKICGEKKDVEIIPPTGYINFSSDPNKYCNHIVYTGKAIKPTVYVWIDEQNRLTEGVDYDVEYIGTCKEIGRHKVIVKFKGDYSGKAGRTFEIYPPNVKTKSVKGIKNGFKVEWKKVGKKYDVDGYIVTVMSGNHENKEVGTCYVKQVKIKGKNKTSATIKGLKRNKKYYVFVQSYKKQNFDYKPDQYATFTSQEPDDNQSWKNIRYKTK